MKKLILLFVGMIPALLFAQQENDYSKGAVPVVDGKVVFSKTITNQDEKHSFDKLLLWANQRFNTEGNKVVFHDKDKGDIATIGSETFTMKKNAIMVDRANMTYTLYISVQEEQITIEVKNIRYNYDVTYQKEPEKFLAEDIITDKYALTRKGKLNKKNGKFRTHTIDFVNALFKEIDSITRK